MYTTVGERDMHFIHKTTETLLIRFLKLTSLSLSAVLGLFCNNPNVATPAYGVVAEYGMPWANYKVMGTVRGIDTHTALKGIHITLSDTGTDSCIFASAYTDTSGKYSISFNDPPWKNTWTLHARDVDGSANGSYKAKDTIISIPDSALDSADSQGTWYSGHGEKTIDLNLDVQ